MNNAGWNGILEDGEEILWQGEPSGRIRFGAGQFFTVIFGLFFAGFALFWMIMAFQAGGFFWAFGLIHFSVGLSLAFGAPFWDRIKRGYTWYTLTNCRAFIATDLPVLGRRLKSYPINENTALDYRETDPPSIYFAQEFQQRKNGSRHIDIGFYGIPDAADVYKQMRDIQKGKL